MAGHSRRRRRCGRALQDPEHAGRRAAAARIGSAWPPGGTRAGRASAGAASVEVAPRRAATALSPVACGARPRRRPAGRPRRRGADLTFPPRVQAARRPGTRRPSARAAAPRARARDDGRERPDRAPPVEALDRGGTRPVRRPSAGSRRRLREAPPDLDALRRRHVERASRRSRRPDARDQLSTSAAGVDSVQSPALRKASRIAAKSEASPRIASVALDPPGQRRVLPFLSPLCQAVQRLQGAPCKALCARNASSRRTTRAALCRHRTRLRDGRAVAMPLFRWGSATSGSHQCATCGAKLLKSKNKFCPACGAARVDADDALGPIGAAPWTRSDRLRRLRRSSGTSAPCAAAASGSRRATSRARR